MTTPVLRMPAPPFPRGARPLADGGQMHARRPGDRTQRPAPEKAKKFPPRAGAARGFGPAPARQHMRQAHTVMRFRAPQPVDTPGAGNPTAGPVSLPAAPGSVECAGVRRLPPSALCAGRGNKKSESMTRFRPSTTSCRRYFAARLRWQPCSEGNIMFRPRACRLMPSGRPRRFSWAYSGTWQSSSRTSPPGPWPPCRTPPCRPRCSGARALRPARSGSSWAPGG